MLAPSRLRAGPLLALVALLALPSGALTAQQYVYALNEKGSLTVNGTVLDKLATSFDQDDFFDKDKDQRWWALHVRGSDRYALRLDGHVNMNGANIHKLLFSSLVEGGWIDLTVTNDGSVWALRSDGRLSRDGVFIVDFPHGVFDFQQIITDGTDVYSLRSDGAVYRNNFTQTLFAFQAGKVAGIGEGKHKANIWDSIALDPTDGQLYALRRDGNILRGDPASPVPKAGTPVANLPFGTSTATAHVYVDLGIAPDGMWWAMRGNGRIFNATDPFLDFLDLPGTPDVALAQAFRKIVPVVGGFFAVRRDGHLFDETGTSLVDLHLGRYRALAVSIAPPDLTSFNNRRPMVTTYRVKAVTGVPLTIPVLAVDTDLAAASLAVDVDPADLPAGVVWDAGTRTFTWAAPGPAGKYHLPVSVADGVPKPVRRTFQVRVRDADTDPAKNRKPGTSRIRMARALVGIELRLPILATDRDGDPLVITPDVTRAPFTQGAVFDAPTSTFIWTTPTLADVGKYTLRFDVDDGTQAVRHKVKLRVMSSILAP